MSGVVTYPGKREANARARAALSGVVVAAIEDDRGRRVYIVSRWALTKQLDTLDDLEAWLDRLDGGACR